MQATSYKVSNDLYLVRQIVNANAPAAPPKPPATNHLVVIDCSGSMYGELPRIREQLKKRIPKLLGEQDTLSVIWFSGRNQYGTLLEAEPVATLADLQAVNNAIDRWLKPVCLTGFKEPIEEAGKLVQRIQKKNKGVFAMIFMSDGCDNQWNRQDILKAVESNCGGLASCTFVEYGYYADRPLLTAMAEKAGGTLIFAQDFDSYAPAFENAIQKKATGAARIEVTVGGDPIGGFVYADDGTDLYAYTIDGNKVSLPQDRAEVSYLSPTSVGKVEADLQTIAKNVSSRSNMNHGVALDAAYAAVSLFSVRMKPDVVLPLLRALGDVQYIEQFSGCFGKQKYSEFMDATKAAAFNTDARFVKGYDPNKMPKDDAYTVLDFLRVLASDDDNRVLLDSKDFRYNRIGRATESAPPKLTAEEIDELQNLTKEIAAVTDVKKLQQLQDRVAAITNKKRPEPLVFVAKEEKDGYAVSNLTFNETRPNVSFLVRKEGTVELKDKPAEYDKIPDVIDTFIHRNYTVIKDGLLNIERLPVRMTGGTVRAMREAGFPDEAIEGLDGEDRSKAVTRVKKASDSRPVSFVVNLSKLPIINRNMVRAVSAKVMFETAYRLTKAQASQKVYNTILKDEFPKQSEGFKTLYGEEGANWLKEQGVTDYNGFNPRRVQAQATDFYMGKQLEVKIKGLSTLPSLTDVRKRIASGKHTASSALMVPALQIVDKDGADALKKGRDEYKEWLNKQKRAATTEVRERLFEIAQIQFAVIVGQVWFSEFSSLDENSLEVTCDGTKVSCVAECKEIQIAI